MRIQCVNNIVGINKVQNSLSFKGDFNFSTPYECDGNFYAGDTSILDRWRDKIYERQGIASASQAPGSLVGKNILDVNLAHFQKLPNSSFSGENLMHKPENYFEVLKSSGIYNIIDILQDGKAGLKERCDKFGINYHHLSLPWNLAGEPIFADDEELLAKQRKYIVEWETTPEGIAKAIDNFKKKITMQRTEFVKKLTDFIDVINRGNYYLSCEYGEYRTKNFLALCSIFNPKWAQSEKVDPTFEFAENIVRMYKNLTSEHKQILGITADYDKFLGEYIAKLAKCIK